MSWTIWPVKDSTKADMEVNKRGTKEYAQLLRGLQGGTTVVRRRKSKDSGAEIITAEVPVCRLQEALGKKVAAALIKGDAEPMLSAPRVLSERVQTLGRKKKT